MIAADLGLFLYFTFPAGRWSNDHAFALTVLSCFGAAESMNWTGQIIYVIANHADDFDSCAVCLPSQMRAETGFNTCPLCRGGIMTGSAVVKSAARVLRVLEMFAVIRRPANASEIEELLDIPQSSTSVLLRSLVSLGYLTYNPIERRYSPTSRVKMLGDWINVGSISSSISEGLQSLAADTQETILLGRRNGSDVQFIYAVLPMREVQFYVREGTSRPLTISAAGRALLSTLPPELVTSITRRLNSDATSKSQLVKEAVLMKELELIRETGISEMKPDFGGERDYHVIAMLLNTQASDDPLSIGVGGPKTRILERRDHIIATMRNWISQL